MKKVLVTGASGLLGRHCLPLLLDAEYEVHATSRVYRMSSDERVHWHAADLLEQGQVIRLMQSVQPTHLLHLAWYTTPGSYWSHDRNLSWVTASLALVQSFFDSGGVRVAVAGTCAEYDWRYGYCTEDLTPVRPDTPYGVSKHSLRLLLESYSQDRELSVTWGRLFFIFGPGEHRERLVPGILRALLNGNIANCKEPAKIRDFLYVKDAAAAFVSLLGSDVEGPINVASGVPVLVGDVATRLGILTGREELVSLNQGAEWDVPDLLVASVQRMRRMVGWSPAYSLEDGLRESMLWWDLNRDI